MNIGETIRKLRRGRDMTQEQLADYLGVTMQAVSRWETGVALPDITQVPALANIFSVTSDSLLGIDITATEARIQEIRDNATRLSYFDFKYAEAIEILRAGLKEYPNSYRLKESLMNELWRAAESEYTENYEKSEAKAEYEAALREAAAVGEQILAECTDDKIRHSAIQILCYAYPNVGETEKALSLADKMPGKELSGGALRSHILRGAELYRHRQRQLRYDLHTLLFDMMCLSPPLADGLRLFTVDERIEVYHKILAICEIMYDGDEVESVSWVYREQLARCYIQKGDTAAAMEQLRLAAARAVGADTAEEAKRDFTCLIFQGLKYGFGADEWTEPSVNNSQSLLNILSSVDASIRGTPEFAAIEAELRERAATRRELLPWS